MPSRIFLMFSVLCVSVPSVFAYNWSDNPGDGTETNPYQVSTLEHLIAINDLDTTGVHFVMTNDIDLSGQTYTSAVIASFSGLFDGDGFVIHNLTGASLFGTIEGDAVVKNLGVENISISFESGGGLAAALSYGLIHNCYTTGTIQGTRYLGGLVGNSYNNGIISDCYNRCNVIGVGESPWQVCYIGGLVGWQTSGQIIRCYNEGTISGGSEVGGLVGSQQGEIHQSYNLGNVIGFDEGYAIGGIAGFQYSGPVKDCYNNGTVEGYSYVGGITGRGGYIQNCYNLGLVSGDQQVGGLSGYDIGSINSFWNSDTSGITSTSPRYGRTSAQMKQAATYIGWNDDGPIWVLDEGIDYPRLVWEGTPGMPLLTHSLSEYLPEGMGTEWDPYRIYTAEQLNAIGIFPNEWDKYFSLENDIDVGSLNQFKKIGTVMIPFSGIFEGNGFAISNFTYITTENEGYVGLFGFGQDAVIQNLRLENVNISSDDRGVGSIAGVMISSILENCSSTGTVSGEGYVGGLLGAGDVVITNCHSSCAVSGNIIVGGFIGNTAGTINNCYSTGQVVANSVQSECIGGFAGQQSYGTIEFCYSTGDVHGQSKVGGFVGMQDCGEYFYPYKNADLVIQNCYSWGNVFTEENSNYIGGLVGYQHTRWVAVQYPRWTKYDLTTSVYNCYSVGHVEVGAGSSDVGGLVGYSHNGTVTDSFWDLETSGQATSTLGTGKTTSEMMTVSTFTDAGWDFTQFDWDPADWHPRMNGYPRLAWESLNFTFGGGSGTPEDPYQIWTAQQMNDIGVNSDYWDKHFKLMVDIDMSAYTGTQYNVIGYDPWICWEQVAFTGSFDGNGHIIRNFTYSSDYADYPVCSLNAGLFGYIQDGVVKNLGLENVTILAKEFIVGAAGGLVGYNNGIVSNCFVTGSIHGDTNIGGLVGVNEGVIENCYVIGSVSGMSWTGGMAGSNYNGSFTNCYAATTIETWEIPHFVGEFVGFGHEGEYCACFWDIDRCKFAENANLDNVTGKTANELQTLSTFIESGWDFIGETANGIDDIWWIRENRDYPRLRWEFTNTIPVADPNEDQVVFAWIDGYAEVQLDGTGSFDEDGDALEFFWYNDANELIATGVEPNVVLGVGEHVIELIVNDSFDDSEPNACVVTVIEPVETTAKMMSQMLNRKSNQPQVIVRIEFAGEEMPELDPNQPMLLVAGQVSIEDRRQMLVYSDEETAWYLMGFFDRPALMEAITEDGDTEVTVAAKLLTGQWVYGKNTITVRR